MKLIPLSGKRGAGEFSVVDDCDYEWASKFRWHLSSSGYAITNKSRPYKNGKTLHMHRAINKTPDGLFTDHVNQNRIDNRRENLRTATKTQNLFNMDKHSDNSSGYKGIVYHRPSGLWGAKIQVKMHRVSLGYYETKKEAANAYNNAAKKLHGQFAYLNKVR